MLRALKVTLIVAAIVGFIFGGMMLIIPDQAGALFNFPEFPQEIRYTVSSLGGMFVAFSVGFVLAARDPARHRILVQVGLVGYALSLVVTIYYLLRGTIGWDIATVPFIIQLVFVIAFAVFYPREQVD